MARVAGNLEVGGCAARSAAPSRRRRRRSPRRRPRSGPAAPRCGPGAGAGSRTVVDPSAPSPASRTAPFDLGAGHRQLGSRCRQPPAADGQGRQAPAVAAVDRRAHQPQRVGHPPHRPPGDVLVAVQDGEPREGGHPAGQQADARCPSCRRRSGRRARAAAPAPPSTRTAATPAAGVGRHGRSRGRPASSGNDVDPGARPPSWPRRCAARRRRRRAPG